MNPVSRWLELLSSRERRKAKRQESPDVVAHYWDGAAPLAHRIRDISSTGLYLLTEQRWYPGTVVRISLQSESVVEADPGHSVVVNAKVVRSGTDGVGLALILPEKHSARGAQSFGAKSADRLTFHNFLQRILGNQGQALIEYVLILPLVLLLIVNVVNFAGFFYAFIAVANAARAGANYAILGESSAGDPVLGTGTTILSLITDDLNTLPNQSSLVVNICQNDNSGTPVTMSGTCPSVPKDPEAPVYVLTMVDITYTYVPFLPAGFGTLPPTTIHRRTFMRSIQ